MKYALLWDIDGTLLDTHGIGKNAMTSAIKSYTKLDVDFDHLKFSGLTDHQIIKALLEYANYSPNNMEFAVEKILELYIQNYLIILKEGKIQEIDNINNILYLSNNQPSIRNWICTGNVFEGAKLKLRSAKLLKYFDEKYFFCSEDISSRQKIVARAKKEALQLGYKPIVIGDTIHDIEAAKYEKIFSVAVESSNYPLKKLKNANPDRILFKGWNFEQLKEAIEID